MRDLGSTNGTYVNRKRVSDERVRDGDVVHFADFEFRLEEAAAAHETTAVLRDLALPEQFVKGTRELDELLRDQLVTMLFQPIVVMKTAEPSPTRRWAGGDIRGCPRVPRSCSTSPTASAQRRSSASSSASAPSRPPAAMPPSTASSSTPIPARSPCRAWSSR